MNKKSGSMQSKESVYKNASFFYDNLNSYNENIQNLDTYIGIRPCINNIIQNTSHLLDIGNGGVFDYDTNLVDRITALDLFLDKLPPSFSCPQNVTLKKGSALDIPEEGNTFDGVLMVMLIHHLVGKTVGASIANVELAIQEAYRVLKPGGKMMIVESCVPRWFYLFERLVFRPASKIIEKIMTHPPTLQYPVNELQKMLEKKFDNVEVLNIPLGRWVLIYGKKVPTFLTPVSIKIFIAKRNETSN